MLVLLEERGLVRRRPHPTDRRARSVKLTARGQRVFTETRSQTGPLRERLTTALFPNEIEELTTSLDRITILLSQGRGAPSAERNAHPTPTRRPGRKGP